MTTWFPFPVPSPFSIPTFHAFIYRTTLPLSLNLKDLQVPCWKYYNWDTITHRPIVLLNWHSDSSKKNFIYKFFCINFKKFMQKWFCRTRCCNNTKSQQLVKTMNIWNSNTFCVLMLKSISPAHMICGQGQVIFSYPLIVFSLCFQRNCVPQPNLTTLHSLTMDPAWTTSIYFLVLLKNSWHQKTKSIKVSNIYIGKIIPYTYWYWSETPEYLGLKQKLTNHELFLANSKIFCLFYLQSIKTEILNHRQWLW